MSRRVYIACTCRCMHQVLVVLHCPLQSCCSSLHGHFLKMSVAHSCMHCYVTVVLP
jgi:hypothetical protein